jgi:hypothetical protein
LLGTALTIVLPPDASRVFRAIPPVHTGRIHSTPFLVSQSPIWILSATIIALPEFIGPPHVTADLPVNVP